MKKFTLLPVGKILPIIFLLVGLLFLSPKAEAQTNIDCHQVFDQELYKCLTEDTKCQSSCVDKARSEMSLKVDGGKVNLECRGSVCDPAKEACDKQVKENFNACIDARKSKEDAPKEAVKKEKTPLEKLSDIPVFVGEWFERMSAAWAGLSFLDVSTAIGREILTDPEIAIWEEEQRQKDEKAHEEYLRRQGYVSQEEMDSIFNRMPTHREVLNFESGVWEKDNLYRLDILKGEASIKYPGEDEWKDLKVGDKIPPASRIFTGMDTTSVMRIRDKGVLQILPFTEIIVNERGLEQASKEGQTTTDIKLRTGEVEASIEGGVFVPTLQITTPNSVAGVRGTKFWVSYDKAKNLSVIGVYEGEVEVKSQGQTHLISPTSDGPGVIVVSQKLSVFRIVIVGVILATIVSGIVWLIKKKTSVKYSKKR